MPEVRFTNGELVALLAAIEHTLALPPPQSGEGLKSWLEAAKAKLDAEFALRF